MTSTLSSHEPGGKLIPVGDARLDAVDCPGRATQTIVSRRLPSVRFRAVARDFLP
jgi:hypothetical protein